MRLTKIVLPLLMLGMICLAATAFVWNGKRSRNSESPKTEMANAVVQQSSAEGGPVRMIRFVLSKDGLYPRQMRVDQGLINVSLEDKTGGSDGLVIESLSGDQRAIVTEVKRVENHWRGRTLVRLTPGRYVLSDASQPSHTAELVVDP